MPESREDIEDTDEILGDDLSAFDLGIQVLWICFVAVCVCGTAIAVAGTVRFIGWMFN